MNSLQLKNKLISPYVLFTISSYIIEPTYSLHNLIKKLKKIKIKPPHINRLKTYANKMLMYGYKSPLNIDIGDNIDYRIPYFYKRKLWKKMLKNEETNIDEKQTQQIIKRYRYNGVKNDFKKLLKKFENISNKFELLKLMVNPDKDYIIKEIIEYYENNKDKISKEIFYDIIFNEYEIYKSNSANDYIDKHPEIITVYWNCYDSEIVLKLLTKHPDKIDLKSLCGNEHPMAIEILKQNVDKIDIGRLCENSHPWAVEKIKTLPLSKIDFYLLSCNSHPDALKILFKHPDKIITRLLRADLDNIKDYVLQNKKLQEKICMDGINSTIIYVYDKQSTYELYKNVAKIISKFVD